MRLAAETITCKLRGNYQPQPVHDSDDQRYITKFHGNPQGTRILADKLLGVRLGAAIGLPSAPLNIIELAPWLISPFPDICLESPQSRVLVAEGPPMWVQICCRSSDREGMRRLRALILDFVLYTNTFVVAFVPCICLGNHQAHQQLHPLGQRGMAAGCTWRVQA